jgi:catechol 2,3-dioxygenase-like lactoylglutathione lyase family enzyme
MAIRWLTAFIDRPAASFDVTAAFWSSVTGSTLSPPRGETGQFATLVPPEGDAYLRVQRIDAGSGGSHLDLHVDDVAWQSEAATAAGATERYRRPGLVILTSPAGFHFCVVGHHGETTRPPSQPVDDAGHLALVDQLCLDVPADRFEDECEFWADLTGWRRGHSTVRPEFDYLDRPDPLPMRLLLQRRDDSDGPARAHLDIACDDVHALVERHVALGATTVERFEHWTTMADPAGLAYCITARDPRTGRLLDP